MLADEQVVESASLLIEAMKRPGIMSLPGLKAERQCKREVAAYFSSIGLRIKQEHFEKLANTNKETAKHIVEMRVGQIVRRIDLKSILESNYRPAFVSAYKQTRVHEADFDSPITVGPASGRLLTDAADYASQQAGKMVSGINDTTVSQISDAVTNAIEAQLAPLDLSKNLQDIFGDWVVSRADMIARTEMADAFGAGALQRLGDDGIEWMQLILSPDACPICQDIADDGPVKVDDGFADGEYDRSPIHPNCRCATVGARAPEGDEDAN